MWRALLLSTLLAVATGARAFAEQPESVPGSPGLTVKDVQSKHAAYDLEFGAIVESISEDGPARKPVRIDIAPGDLIIAANGHPVTDKRSFTKLVSDLFAGNHLKLVRLRRNEAAEVEIILTPSAGAGGPRKRLALVIGNAGYCDHDVAGADDGLFCKDDKGRSFRGPFDSLKTSLHDVELLAKSLKDDLHFDVMDPVLDGSKSHMLNAVIEFANRLQDASAGRAKGDGPIGVLYYSGHGRSVEGKNFLLPVDIKSLEDVGVRSEGLDIDEITRTLNHEAPLAEIIVVFDACRTVATSSKGGEAQGFIPADLPGMVIAYSTAPGRTAPDRVVGKTGAGLFATALAEAVVLQGFSVRDVFDKVGLEIAKKGDGQKPWTSTSYGASAGWYLNGRLTKEQQDRIERDAVRIARESREATDRGDAAVGALLALETLPTGEASDLEWGLASPAHIALDAALRKLTLLVVIPGSKVWPNSAALSDDGTRILTASDDGNAQVWETETGLPTPVRMQTDGPILRAAYSPDGTRVVTTTENKGVVQVWAARTGGSIWKVTQDRGPVISVDFSSDGTKVVTGSEYGAAQVWDVATGSPVFKPMEHNGRVYTAKFSRDGIRVVTASVDGTARVWNTVTGEFVSMGHDNGQPVYTARFSSDGMRVLTASEDGTAQVWDAATGVPVSKPMKHRGRVFTAQFSGDGKRVVTASGDGTARVWDAATGDPVAESMVHGEGKPVLSARFSPDGTSVVTASEDKTARIWDTSTGEELRPVRMIHDGAVSDAAFTRDGKWVVTKSIDGTVRIWDCVVSASAPKLLKHSKSVSVAAFSPDGQRVLTASQDQRARVWNAVTGTAVSEIMEHDWPVSSAAFSPDGKLVVTATGFGAVQVWEAETGKKASPRMGSKGRTVRSASFSPDGTKVMTASENGDLQIWQIVTGTLVPPHSMSHPRINAAAFSADGKRILTASDDGTARVWNTVTGEFVSMGHDNGQPVYTARFSSDGMRVLTASEDGTAQVWDAATGVPVSKPMKHRGRVFTAQFSGDGKRVVTASGDGTARVWNAATGDPISVDVMHHSSYEDGTYQPVHSAEFSPDGTQIVTASKDGTARLWDAATGKLLCEPMEHLGPVLSAVFDPDGERVVTASQDGKARVWSLLPIRSKLVAVARKTLPLCLTANQRSEDYLLPHEPPAWCKNMKKWPYQDSAKAGAN